MKKIYISHFCYSFTLLLLFSCQTTPELKGFDAEAWQKDDFGCQGKRAELLSDFEKNKEQIMELGQNQVIAIFGKPDIRQPYKRGQVFYVYFYEPKFDCKKMEREARGKAVILRFDAIDRVSEITMEEFKVW